MIRLAPVFTFALAAGFAAVQEAADFPAGERSAAFMPGPSNPWESFGTVEGGIWLGLACLAAAGIFVCLHLSRGENRKCRRSLDAIEARLEGTGKPDE
jgi:hypothetical protein